VRVGNTKREVGRECIPANAAADNATDLGRLAGSVGSADSDADSAAMHTVTLERPGPLLEGEAGPDEPGCGSRLLEVRIRMRSMREQPVFEGVCDSC